MNLKGFSYYLLYKPFGVLSQFSDSSGMKRTLGEFYPFPKDVYPVGRLDEDSEGLILLTNDPAINSLLTGNGVEKEYWVQVEGIPDEASLAPIKKGVTIRVNKSDYRTLPAKAHLLEKEPHLPPRNPPVRFRKTVPDGWISICICEGKNRQVRKMTAAIGFPTLRLVRVRIAKLLLGNMKPGDVIEIQRKDIAV